MPAELSGDFCKRKTWLSRFIRFFPTVGKEIFTGSGILTWLMQSTASTLYCWWNNFFWTWSETQLSGMENQHLQWGLKLFPGKSKWPHFLQLWQILRGGGGFWLPSVPNKLALILRYLQKYLFWGSEEKDACIFSPKAVIFTTFNNSTLIIQLITPPQRTNLWRSSLRWVTAELWGEQQAWGKGVTPIPAWIPGIQPLSPARELLYSSARSSRNLDTGQGCSLVHSIIVGSRGGQAGFSSTVCLSRAVPTQATPHKTNSFPQAEDFLSLLCCSVDHFRFCNICNIWGCCTQNLSSPRTTVYLPPPTSVSHFW